jgi:hypothetical protein
MHPGGEEEGRVGEFGGIGETEFASQVGPVVQTDIGYEAKRTIGSPQRLSVKPVFEEEIRENASQREVFVAP